MGRNKIKEIRVGAVIIVALAIIIGVVFTLGEDSQFIGKKVKYKILFNSTNGLYEGDPVLLTGVEVGNVTKIGFPKDIDQLKILVEIEVGKEVSTRIRKDTRARIGAASLVYGKVIQLSMGSPGEPMLEEGDIIEIVEGGGFFAVVDSTSIILEDLRSVISKIDRGEGFLGALLTESLESRQMIENLSESTEHFVRLLERLDEGRGPLGSLFSDSLDFQHTLEDFQTASDDLKEVVNNLKSKKSVMGRLINDSEYGKAVTEDLRLALHSIASITAKIDSGKGSLGCLINDRELYTGLENVVLGMKKSSIAKWAIRNRREAGEKERQKQEVQQLK